MVFTKVFIPPLKSYSYLPLVLLVKQMKMTYYYFVEYILYSSVVFIVPFKFIVFWSTNIRGTNYEHNKLFIG